MKVAGLVLALASSAAAFAPAPQKASSALRASLGDMPGNTAPIKTFDPFDLATLGSDETLAWFRAAELKHSRVAMLATTGYLVQAAGIHFPGMLSKDVSFESLSTMKPFDAWDAVPDNGKIDTSGKILCPFGIFTQLILSVFDFQESNKSLEPSSLLRSSLRPKDPITPRVELFQLLSSPRSISPVLTKSQ
jgi:hypothetical protein